MTTALKILREQVRVSRQLEEALSAATEEIFPAGSVVLVTAPSYRGFGFVVRSTQGMVAVELEHGSARGFSVEFCEPAGSGFVPGWVARDPRYKKIC